MRQDGPTVPNLNPQEPGASASPQAGGEKLIWPRADDRKRRPVELKETPSGYVSSLVFGVSLGANFILLAALVGVLLLAWAGISSYGAVGSSIRGTTLRTPTATATLTPSPSPSAATLQVAPNSVQLGCASGQKTQYVTLQNTGSARVSWQATFSVSTQEAGVTISPQRGELAAGGSMPIQLQNTTHSTGSQGVTGRQGVITFIPMASEDNPDNGTNTGATVTLSYTTVGCH
jgi:hypothetical protein